MGIFEHPRLTPEEAAALIKRNGESELLSAEEIASGLRDHVEEFGPAEVETGGKTYEIWTEGAEPYAPDLEGWAEMLALDIERTPTNYQGHPDVPEEAALALVGALEPEHLDRFTDALLEAAPGLRQRFSDQLLGELKEELSRRHEDQRAGIPVWLAGLRAVEAVEADWRQER